MAKEKKEVNENSKGSRFRVTLLIVLLFGVFLGFGFALGGVNIINKAVGSNDVTTTSTDKKATNDNAKYTEIAVDVMIENLYERVKTFTSTGAKVSEMSDKEKGVLASRYFMRYDEFYQYDNSHHLKEADVQYAYDSIFGAGTYKSGQTIYTSCSDYNYDATKKEYITYQDGCGGTSAQAVYSKVVKAEKAGNMLKVTAGVLYVDGSEDKVYRDFEKTKTLGNTIGEYLGTAGEYQEMYAKRHIENTVDTCELYTYTFEADNNGFYKYVGFERTQEAK
ncbi:MAG: hypothetical protein IJI22_04835 [Bacilli bacterium]|nr:hypothetical protein [Bacilli bacterium]